MKIQAEVSLYPLRTGRLEQPVETFRQLLLQEGLEIDLGPMSTRIYGDCEPVFSALRQAFVQIAEEYEAVLTIKISNACPGKTVGDSHA